MSSLPLKPSLRTVSLDKLPKFLQLIRLFVEECCVLSPDAKMNSAELQEAFVLWRGYRTTRPARERLTWENLCWYLGCIGCTRDPKSNICQGLALKPTAPRFFPAPVSVADDLGDPFAYWRTRDAYEQLVVILRWLQQRTEERLQMQKHLNGLLANVTPQSIEEAAQTIRTSLSAYRAELAHQYNNYLAMRRNPFGPYQVGQVPTPDNIRLICDLILEWKEEAFAQPFVREILVFLRGMGENESIPLEHRESTRALVQQLYAYLTPKSDIPHLQEETLAAVFRRKGMLATYEEEYAKLRRFFAQHWNNPHARVLQLQKLYPNIQQEELWKWRKQHCERIAQGLVARKYNSTPETIRKLLQQARKERRHFEALDNACEA